MTVSPDLDARFRSAAATAGLLDVGFDVVDSPIGPLLLAATDRGVCRISFEPDPDRHLDLLARTFGPRVLRAAAPVEAARMQLEEYFAGGRHDFDLPIDVRATAPFAQRVLAELALVPYGETTP